MNAAVGDWRTVARDRAIAQFREAWERAPVSGREALVAAAQRDRIGHKWETGSRACVLALLARPALRPGELAKAGAYRLFGCEVADDFPATWDGAGVTAAELLASVGVYLPGGRPEPLPKRLLHVFRVRRAAHAG